MSDRFDPYREWLQIRDERRPPTYYDLLGLAAFESDTELTHSAAMARMQHLRTFTLGPDREAALKLIAEVMTAVAHLSDPNSKNRYDKGLRTGRIVSETFAHQIGLADMGIEPDSMDPRLWETEAARSRKPQRKRRSEPQKPPSTPMSIPPVGIARTARTDKRHTSLRSMAAGFRALAYSVITIGVLAGVLLAVLITGGLPALWIGIGSVTMALAMDAILVAVVVLITVAAALLCFSLAETIEVVLEIERHTRQTRRVLKGIAAEFESANRRL